MRFSKEVGVRKRNFWDKISKNEPIGLLEGSFDAYWHVVTGFKLTWAQWDFLRFANSFWVCKIQEKPEKTLIFQSFTVKELSQHLDLARVQLVVPHLLRGEIFSSVAKFFKKWESLVFLTPPKVAKLVKDSARIIVPNFGTRRQIWLIKATITLYLVLV